MPKNIEEGSKEKETHEGREGSLNLVDRKIDTGDGGGWIVKTCQKVKPKNRYQIQAGEETSKVKHRGELPKSQMKRGPKEKRRKRKLKEC